MPVCIQEGSLSMCIDTVKGHTMARIKQSNHLVVILCFYTSFLPLVFPITFLFYFCIIWSAHSYFFFILVAIFIITCVLQWLLRCKKKKKKKKKTNIWIYVRTCFVLLSRTGFLAWVGVTTSWNSLLPGNLGVLGWWSAIARSLCQHHIHLVTKRFKSE